MRALTLFVGKRRLIPLFLCAHMAVGSAAEPPRDLTGAPEGSDANVSYLRVTRGDAARGSLRLAARLRGRLDQLAGILGSRLSAEDTALLTSLAAVDEEHANHIRRMLADDQRTICAGRNGKSAAELEAQFTQSIEKASHESDRYYDGLIQGLSPAGRAVILDYLGKEGTREITSVRLDTATFARERPAEALAAIDAACTATRQAPRRPEAIAPAPHRAVGTIVR